MDWRAMGLSFQLAAWTTTILFLVGLPLGYWLAMTRWRWKFLVEALAALPLLVEVTVKMAWPLVLVTAVGGVMVSTAPSWRRTVGQSVPRAGASV